MKLLTCPCPLLPRQERRLQEKALVLRLLSTHLGHPIRLSYNGVGQPYLRDYPKLYISISHTEGLVGVLLSEEAIGLDIERIGERVPRVAPRILSPATIREIEHCTLTASSILYHLAWTGAEALYKLSPESELVSDFEYIPNTYHYNPRVEYPYRFDAKSRHRPEVSLSVQAQVKENYIISIARYASTK